MRSFQQALNVTGHNVSNVNTPGFSRQAVDFGQTDPQYVYGIGGQLAFGSGVTINSVNRMRSAFLDAQAGRAASDLGSTGTMAGKLSQVTGIYGPTTSGIKTALDAFWNSWSALASQPDSQALRSSVQAAGQTLADQVRGTWREFDAAKTQTDTEVVDTIKQVNDLAGEIAALNAQIRAAAVQGAEPNDLLDKRDQALQELSGLVNVTSKTFQDGTVSVFISQFTLVDTAGAYTLPSTYDAQAGTVSDSLGSYTIRSGKLSGLFQGMVSIEAQMGKLDSLANTLRTQVNSIHKTIPDPDTTERFFNDSAPNTPQNGASDFDLAAPIKADASLILAGSSGNAGDAGIALSLSQLRETPIGALGARTFGEFFVDAATSAASQQNYFESVQGSQSAVMSQIEAQRQSLSGVSLDDEMANMLRFQRSYQAAAKALTVFDQVTEDLINMLRR